MRKMKLVKRKGRTVKAGKPLYTKAELASMFLDEYCGKRYCRDWACLGTELILEKSHSGFLGWAVSSMKLQLGVK